MAGMLQSLNLGASQRIEFFFTEYVDCASAILMHFVIKIEKQMIDAWLALFFLLENLKDNN